VPAGVAYVADVCLLSLVELTEHLLEQHVGEPDHRVERRTQLVGHARQELGLVAARHLELPRLLLELAEQAGVVDGDCRLACERLHKLGRQVSEGTRDRTSDNEHSDYLLLAKQRNCEHRSPSGLTERVDVGIERFQLEVGCLTGFTRGGRAAQERAVELDRRCPKGFLQLRARAVAGAQPEAPGRGVELEDRATLSPRQLDGARHNRREYLLKVERRADRLARLAQGMQLFHRLAELPLAPLELLEELDVLYRDSALGGERGSEVYRPLVEGLDFLSPEDDHTDDSAVGHHRHAEHRAEATQLPRLVQLVVWIGEHVAYVHRAPGQADTPNDRAVPSLERDSLDVVAVLLRRTKREGHAIDVVVEHIDQAGVCLAEPDGLLQHRLERGL
jgi:hypothetical protein